MRINGEVSRIVVLDALRAILIFFVVFGHSQCCLDQAPLARELVYSFHMPAMFTLSGVVAALSRGAGDWGKIGRSARRLLIPYALCGLVFLPAWLLVYGGRGWDVFPEQSLNVLVRNRGLWYLPACFLLVGSLVLVEQGAACVRRWLAGRWLGTGWASRGAAGAAVLLLVVAVYWTTRCDFLRSVLSYWFSFYAGAMLARRLDWLTRPRWWAACGSLLVWIALALVFVLHPHTLLGNVLKPFTGLAAMLPLAVFAALFCRVPGFARIGESTLAVYCVEGIVGWRFFQLVAPANVLTAALWSLALVLVVHGTRMVLMDLLPNRC